VSGSIRASNCIGKPAFQLPRRAGNIGRTFGGARRCQRRRFVAAGAAVACGLAIADCGFPSANPQSTIRNPQSGQEPLPRPGGLPAPPRARPAELKNARTRPPRRDAQHQLRVLHGYNRTKRAADTPCCCRSRGASDRLPLLRGRARQASQRHRGAARLGGAEGSPRAGARYRPPAQAGDTQSFRTGAHPRTSSPERRARGGGTSGTPWSTRVRWCLCPTPA